MNLTPSLHTRYSLGTDKVTRLDAFRRLLTGTDTHDVSALPLHTQQHKPWGSKRFRQQIRALAQRSVEVRPCGPPRSNAEK